MGARQCYVGGGAFFTKGGGGLRRSKERQPKPARWET